MKCIFQKLNDIKIKNNLNYSYINKTTFLIKLAAMSVMQ